MQHHVKPIMYMRADLKEKDKQHIYLTQQCNDRSKGIYQNHLPRITIINFSDLLGSILGWPEQGGDSRLHSL